MQNTNSERERMLRLEDFGIGVFSEKEIEEKVAFIKNIFSKRPIPEHPHISVVLPVYKEENYILATLRSLAEQTDTDCEFIVVSNGEPFGNPTQKLAEACGFRVIHDPHGGISRARQTGLEAAKGEIVVTTDADTVHHSRWLERINEIMSDKNILCGAGVWRTTSKKISVRAAFAFIAWTHNVKNIISPMLITGVSEATSFYRRKEALNSGGYDLGVFLSEGLVMFRKLRKPGVPIIFKDEELIVATSGRRQEKIGALHWLLMGFYNAALQLFGRKGVSHKTYPAIR